VKFPIIAVLLLAALTCHATTIEGRVVGVADGDTVTVLDADKVQHKIRLSGIDAPEKKQPFGNRSKESLSDLVFDKAVTVETDKRDRYQREVGKVLVDGVDANLEQVKRGMAWHYKAYEREQSAIDRKAYSDAEIEAKGARLGLWAGLEPMPPWDFRHNK
jgi:endonuclease YncB( thermonuclease family)